MDSTSKTNGKWIQHQKHNCKLDLMYPENYVWTCVHANDLGQNGVLQWVWFLYDFKIKNTIGGWPDEFHDIVYKNTKASAFSNVMVKTVSLDNNWGKKRFFEKKKKMFRFDKGTFSAFLVVWEKCLKGSNLKRYWVDSFL